MKVEQTIESKWPLDRPGLWDGPKNRHPTLKKLVGPVKLDFTLDIQRVLTDISDENKERIIRGELPLDRHGRQVKLSKALTNVDIEYVTNMMKWNGKEMTFSCRIKDLLRCSHGRHFDSCFRPHGQYTDSRVELVANPLYGIIYRRDKRGDFEYRMLVKLIGGRHLICQTLYCCPHTMTFKRAMVNAIMRGLRAKLTALNLDIVVGFSTVHSHWYSVNYDKSVRDRGFAKNRYRFYIDTKMDAYAPSTVLFTEDTFLSAPQPPPMRPASPPPHPVPFRRSQRPSFHIMEELRAENE